ncbi:AAA family ATPase [Muricauda sp. HICW]|uniref:AAA family ATPase n=1 Tax=Flagellimonas chongwuensis TaxID=2697365 RepID=A0A850NQ47_9FLAO|nr:ATP-binding protein [Allomuricauda chongwuensis]NVN19437.1 AAA family ATPase [Allomuricauda chongwuensis]
MDIKELLDQLNHSDECSYIEAKKGSAIDRSIMETVCAFSNEPGLGGGYILLGVEEETQSLFPSYINSGVSDPDKLQLDLSSQCASMFNTAIRPQIDVENIGGKNIIKVFIPEAAEGTKPIYFQKDGLPRGAYRRIGSSDQRCTDDDLLIFFQKEETFDSSIVHDASWDDISEDSIALYRKLREKVNPYAEELQYNDKDLLYSLGCAKKIEGKYYPTHAGLLLFGSRIAHRRLLPMVRVDYIRVPGNEWVEDPDNRFTTIDMRGSLLEMVQRVFSQITDDLPKGFLLPEGELQAESVGLPSRVLREAIVNALIHRSYREHQPIQIIRYGNRLEIKNPGFSLKPEDHLGEPGSKNRNPNIAAVFHETNLAETKGSGINTMRKLMEKANLLPPTFESDHSRNTFTARLLLHHFLGTDDLEWLSGFDSYGLSENQKRGLILVKEMGAVDNSTYRQTNNIDTLRASAELRDLSKKELLSPKGKGRATYYVPGNRLNTLPQAPSTPLPELSTPPPELSTPPPGITTPPPGITRPLKARVPQEILERISQLGARVHDESLIKGIVSDMCAESYFKAAEIAELLEKREDYIKRKYLSTMIDSGELRYKFPDMLNHPEQAYISTKKITS